MRKIRFIWQFSSARQTFSPGVEVEVGGIDLGTATNAVGSGFAVDCDAPEPVPAAAPAEPAASSPPLTESPAATVTTPIVPAEAPAQATPKKGGENAKPKGARPTPPPAPPKSKRK